MERSKKIFTNKSEKAKGKAKVVEVPKKKKAKAPKNPNAPLKIVEGGQRARKGRVPSSSESSESSGEEDEIVETRRTKKVKEVIPYKTYFAAVKKGLNVPTKWADVELITKIGIFEEVRTILRNVGLGKLLEMNYPCYHDQVVQLVASFEIKMSKMPRTPLQLGRVSFEVDGKLYELQFSEICVAYGFKQAMASKFVSNVPQDKRLWGMIGQGDYRPGKTKAKWISHPAVRYFHKLLAHTIFARHETDKVNEDEMALITNGLMPFFEDQFQHNMIEPYEDVNLGIVLAKKIMLLKKGALREENKKWSLHLGAFLTPLLIAANVPLRNPSSAKLQRIDFLALKRMDFVTGREEDRITYTFIGSDHKLHMVTLPNEVITRLDCIENLSFANGEALGMDEEERVEPLALGIEQVEEEAREEERTDGMEIPLGSPRYYHTSYTGKITSKSIEHALEGVKKNQRWNKWNSRSIHNIKRSCKKKVKALQQELSTFKAMFETYVFRKKSPPRRDDGEFDFNLAMEEARRNSMSHLPSSSTSMAHDAPRASSYEQGTSRKRRNLRIRTPSPPSSENPSLHLSDSESE